MTPDVVVGDELPGLWLLAWLHRPMYPVSYITNECSGTRCYTGAHYLLLIVVTATMLAMAWSFARLAMQPWLVTLPSMAMQQSPGASPRGVTLPHTSSVGSIEESARNSGDWDVRRFWRPICLLLRIVLAWSGVILSTFTAMFSNVVSLTANTALFGLALAVIDSATAANSLILGTPLAQVRAGRLQGLLTPPSTLNAVHCFDMGVCLVSHERACSCSWLYPSAATWWCASWVLQP